MKKRSIHIVEMGKHFLYLPLYFARHKNFFGFLPEDVHVEIDQSVPRTDKAAYLQMMSEEPEFRDCVMAIADPVQAYRTELNAKRRPAILATLVTNSGFWAVNHGSKTINGLRDLGAFERVIAFEPGTTSYGIAARIARESGTTKPLKDFIEVVDPGGELLLLTDPKSGNNAVALSPDLLRIEWMEQNNIGSIELRLGQTAEYNDVLVTALLSYESFVKENPEIVSGIVKGIQQALLLTRAQDPEVIEYAESKFNFREHIPGAIDKAIDSEVFPLSVTVAQAHWLHASKAFFETVGTGGAWSKSDELRALEYYKSCVSPYANVGQSATTSTLEQKATRARPDWKWPLGLIVVAVAIGQFVGGIPALIFVGGFFLTWWLSRQSSVANYPFVYWTSLALAVPGTFCLGIPFAERFHAPEATGAELRTAGLAMLIGALAMAGVGYGIDYAERSKK